MNWKNIRDGKMGKEAFFKRAVILDALRQWFRDQEFLEVETPLMVKHPGMEPHLNLFSSHFEAESGSYKEKRFLHTSPEYSMKKLLGAGFTKIFQLTKVFRNGEIGQNHNPEFTMLEWYRTEADYQDIMDDTENMIRYIAEQIQENGGNQEICEFLLQQTPWERLTVHEAFKRYANMDLNELRDFESLKTAVEQKNYTLNTNYDWDDLFFLVLLNEIEPHLGKERPQFLIDYPASQAALAKKKSDDPFWAERFELYVKGVELCNAFSELIDPVEQKERLEEEWQLRKDLGKETYDIDESFLEALSTMPPSGGNALGIDRLVMLLLGKKNLKEVLLFPWEDV